MTFLENIPKTEEIAKILQGTDWLYVILLPIALMFIVSFYIGYERQNVGKAAGVSSHILVGLASVSLAIVQRIMYYKLVKMNVADGSAGQRIIAQVITGVSFIGAGVVMKNKKSVKGLTTAATIWAVAAIGIVYGSGYLIVGSLVSSIIILFLTFRDITRGINPLKPTSERMKQIKKYTIDKVDGKHVLNSHPSSNDDSDEDL